MQLLTPKQGTDTAPTAPGSLGGGTFLPPLSHHPPPTSLCSSLSRLLGALKSPRSFLHQSLYTTSSYHPGLCSHVPPPAQPSLTPTKVILLARIWEPELASRCHPHVTNQEGFLCPTSCRHHQSQGQSERRGRLVHAQKRSANSSCQRQTNKYLGLSGHMVSVTTAHLCY